MKLISACILLALVSCSSPEVTEPSRPSPEAVISPEPSYDVVITHNPGCEDGDGICTEGQPD